MPLSKPTSLIKYKWKITIRFIIYYNYCVFFLKNVYSIFNFSERPKMCKTEELFESCKNSGKIREDLRDPVYKLNFVLRFSYLNCLLF